MRKLGGDCITIDSQSGSRSIGPFLASDVSCSHCFEKLSGDCDSVDSLSAFLKLLITIRKLNKGSAPNLQREREKKSTSSSERWGVSEKEEAPTRDPKWRKAGKEPSPLSCSVSRRRHGSFLRKCHCSQRGCLQIAGKNEYFLNKMRGNEVIGLHADCT
ncbi:hypothetical protein CEXT_86361 [Caerostris extrusa]|uniref:Uncharacterized protein n=1 Tax=Caerostris extrusa TaxID=172846 RepID=A0AAV4XP04_CAEEX|nr:hypothetical protein CEXT_86361 [Caerostris extrusa]